MASLVFERLNRVREVEPTMSIRYSLFGAVLATVSSAVGAADIDQELIFSLQEKHVHSSSVVEAADGTLLVCWYQGSGERSANDVRILGASKPAAGPWTKPFLLADTPGLPDCNPVLWIDAKSRLWLFWIVPVANRWEHSLLKYRRADAWPRTPTKNAAPKWTWQDAIVLQPGERFVRQLEAGLDKTDLDEDLWSEYALRYSKNLVAAARDAAKRQVGWMPRIKPVVLPSGRIVLPLYSDGFNVSLMALSDDLGATWRASGPLVGLGPVQPAIARKTNGELVAYLRDNGGAPKRVLVSTSKDDGETWSVARDSDIPNPASSVDVVTLPGGEWVLVFNDTENGRHRLALALSSDEGKTWSKKRLVERGEAGNGFSYPALIVGRDGRLHLTYSYHVNSGRSIKHVAVDPAWIAR